MVATNNFREANKQRVATGLFVADAIAGVLFALSGLVTENTSDISLLGFLVSLLVGVGYSLVVIIVLALPMFVVLRYLKLVNLWSAMIAGLAIGVMVAAFFGLPTHGFVDIFHVNLREDAVVRALIFGAIGIASALGFWLVWRKT
ncbi:MAG: hypothetical protein ACLPV8_21195 [Steroidobacteraceae bacterium]